MSIIPFAVGFTFIFTALVRMLPWVHRHASLDKVLFEVEVVSAVTLALIIVAGVKW